MEEAAAERPLAITILCVLTAIGLPFAVGLIVVGPSIPELPGWYTPFLAGSTLVNVACMYGLWNMQKWAVFLYTGMTAVDQIALMAAGLWKTRSILIALIVIAILFSNLGKMR